MVRHRFLAGDSGRRVHIQHRVHRRRWRRLLRQGRRPLTTYLLDRVGFRVFAVQVLLRQLPHFHAVLHGLFRRRLRTSRLALGLRLQVRGHARRLELLALVRRQVLHHPTRQLPTEGLRLPRGHRAGRL